MLNYTVFPQNRPAFTMLKFLSRVRIEFNAMDPRTASCMEFLAQCNASKAKESNPSCQVQVKRRTDDEPPKITVTFVNGVEQVFDAISTPAQTIRQLILEKGQLSETEQMFREAGEAWPVLIPPEELHQPAPGSKVLDHLVKYGHQLIYTRPFLSSLVDHIALAAATCFFFFFNNVGWILDICFFCLTTLIHQFVYFGHMNSTVFSRQKVLLSFIFLCCGVIHLAAKESRREETVTILTKHFASDHQDCLVCYIIFNRNNLTKRLALSETFANVLYSSSLICQTMENIIHILPQNMSLCKNNGSQVFTMLLQMRLPNGSRRKIVL